MIIQTFIEEYIGIENNPKHYHKRSQLLTQLLARYPEAAQTSFNDLLLILDQLKQGQASIRMPLFTQCIYPVLEREITSGNPDAIYILLQHISLLNKYNYMKKNYDGYNEMKLVNLYLQFRPDDKNILMKKARMLAGFMDYALHELPLGVLYGINGATVDECAELLETLEDYKAICQKLQLDDDENIRHYAMHFQGYQDYLLHRDLYKNYADYIQQHNF